LPTWPSSSGCTAGRSQRIWTGQAYLEEGPPLGPNQCSLKLTACTKPAHHLQMSGNDSESMPRRSPPDSGSQESAPGPAGAGQPAASDRRRHVKLAADPTA
jgi:hypothetical protein